MWAKKAAPNSGSAGDLTIGVNRYFGGG